MQNVMILSIILFIVRLSVFNAECLAVIVMMFSAFMLNVLALCMSDTQHNNKKQS